MDKRTPMSDVIYLPELARKLGMTEAAVRGHIQRRTDAIPPYFWLGKRIAWRSKSVDGWLEKKGRKATSERFVRPALRRLGGST